MPVVALAREPELGWPGVVHVPCFDHHAIQAQGGQITLRSCEPRELAAVIDRLYADPERVQALSRDADAYAATISWEALRPKWLGVLHRAWLEAGGG